MPRGEGWKTMFELVILLTVHNRRAKSEECLKSLVLAAELSNISLCLYVFDDGSTDGSADLFRQHVPAAKILTGDGTAFWSRGMANVEEQFLSDSKSRVFSQPPLGALWLNNDVMLFPGSLSRFCKTRELFPDSILVGSTVGSEAGKISYGGLLKKGRHPLGFRLDERAREGDEFDTFNGNFVWVPHSAMEKIGGIDGRFRHGYGDIDYGLAAAKNFVKIRSLGPPVGTCEKAGQPVIASGGHLGAYFSVKGPGDIWSQILFFAKQKKLLLAPYWIFSSAVSFWLRSKFNLVRVAKGE